MLTCQALSADREPWIPVLNVFAENGDDLLGVIYWGYKNKMLSPHCVYNLAGDCHCPSAHALYKADVWGRHGMCRLSRGIEVNQDHKGRPLAFLICWLRLATDPELKTQKQHLDAQQRITRWHRLAVGAEFAQDSEF